MSDTLVTVEHVSKKFTRDLKRSLWYGAKDVAADLGDSFFDKVTYVGAFKDSVSDWTEEWTFDFR